MTYNEIIRRISLTRIGRWIASQLASRIDPYLYRLSRGRLTSVGPQVLPQLVLTTTGRKSGKPRRVQLAYTPVDGEPLVVASNWGGERHPAWSYNLDARPDAEIQVGSESYPVRAERLSDAEKEAVWSQLTANVPQYDDYRRRTDRDLKVYRLRRV